MLKADKEISILSMLNWGSAYLKANNNSYALKETESLLSRLLNCGRMDLYLKNDICLNDDIVVKFKILVKNRALGAPLQYLNGRCFFYGLEFLTAEKVFIPRPETEILVEEVINLAKNNFKGRAVRILELCTGSGIIAVTLTKHIHDCRILATDISLSALTLAEKNAKLHNLKDKISFAAGDLFSALNKTDAVNETFDLIVANPPYIAAADMKKLPPDVRHEPKEALEAGADGLYFYVKILENVRYFLKERGFIAFELGDNQADSIGSLIGNCGIFDIPVFHHDLRNVKRVVIARRNDG